MVFALEKCRSLGKGRSYKTPLSETWGCDSQEKMSRRNF